MFHGLDTITTCLLNELVMLTHSLDFYQNEKKIQILVLTQLI